MVVRASRQEVRTRPVPDHVRDRVIDDCRPQDDEQHQRPELHALRKAADDQRWRDAGEGHLEDDVSIFRNIDLVGEGRGEGRRIDALQERLAQAADELSAAGKGHGIAPTDPHQRGDADDRKDLHQNREHVLRSHEAAVEQRKARHGHHQDQRGAGQHPRRVALVDHVSCWLERRRRSGRRLGERRTGREQGNRAGDRPKF